MKLAIFLTLLLAVTALAYDARVDVIEGEYIVVLHKNADLAAHLDKVSAFVSDVNVMHKYSIGSFKGYAVENFQAQNLGTLLQSPDVAYIAPNQMAYSTECHSSRSESWGLQRTSLKGGLPGNPPIGDIPYKWADAHCGRGIEAHVIDTGIYTEHNDFGGRATFGFDSTGEGAGDGNGHGTHVASTMVGTNYGIARCSNVVAVKVLSRSGSGSFAGVIAGVQYSADAARSKKIVANMSLGGGRNQALNDAATAAVNAGLLLVVAAGNSNRDAAEFSPASADKVWTIGSTESNDQRSSFSNYGSLVNVFAPGGLITAAWIGNPTATRSISGTSMASPHAAGVATKYWSSHTSLSPVQVMSALETISTKDVVGNPGSGSPNRMLFHDCDTQLFF